MTSFGPWTRWILLFAGILLAGMLSRRYPFPTVRESDLVFTIVVIALLVIALVFRAIRRGVS